MTVLSRIFTDRTFILYENLNINLSILLTLDAQSVNDVSEFINL